jgi:hypothetical protein
MRLKVYKRINRWPDWVHYPFMAILGLTIGFFSVKTLIWVMAQDALGKLNASSIVISAAASAALALYFVIDAFSPHDNKDDDFDSQVITCDKFDIITEKGEHLRKEFINLDDITVPLPPKAPMPKPKAPVKVKRK